MIYSLNEGLNNTAQSISSIINNRIKLIERTATEIEKSVNSNSKKPNKFLVDNQKNLSKSFIVATIKKDYYSDNFKSANKKQIAMLMTKCSKDGEYTTRLTDSKKKISEAVKNTSNEFLIKVNKACNSAIKDVEDGLALLKRYFRTDSIEESTLFDDINLL